jgi:hypothetical protein
VNGDVERDAIEGLRRSEALLGEYASEHGLSLVSESPWPGYLPAEQQSGPIRHAVWSLAGRLPGGAAGRLRHQAVYGRTVGMDVAMQHTIMVCRLPESVGYVPMLCCRPDELGMGLYYWGGDQRPREKAKFESAELDRRYVIDYAGGQDANWLYQLFSPKFVDWLAHETPRDFGFKLDSGVFTCETPQWRGQETDGEVSHELLDLLANTGGRVAGRIRDEVLEEVAGTERPDGPSAAAHAEWATGKKHGRIVGLILKLAGGEEDDGIAAYAESRGLESEPPAEFHTRYIRLPLPGVATGVATGTLPGTSRRGSLAWLEYSSDVDMQEEYVAAVTEFNADLPTSWVGADEIALPGFGEEVPSDALAAAREAGFGISTAGNAACVYERSSGTRSKEDVDDFAARAVAVLDLLGAAG